MKIILIAVFMMLSVVGCSNAAVVVFSQDGSYITKASISDAATSADCSGKTVVVTTPQTMTTAITWPSDRLLKFEKGAYVTYSGSGALTNLPSSDPRWFGSTINTTSIQAAINAVASGGVVNIGDAGSVTITSHLIINNPCSINIGNATITSNITTPQWVVDSSGVTFTGASSALTNLVSTNTVSGNIIQWGETGLPHTYSGLTIKNINFTLPLLPTAPSTIDSYRTTLGAIVAKTYDIHSLNPSSALTVTDCIFNEGADQISLEQVNYFTSKNNIHNSTKGRGILFWNCSYYNVYGNTFLDSAGTAVNFIEGFYTSTLSQMNDYGVISNNNITGTAYEAIQLKGAYTTVSNNILHNVKGVGIGIGQTSFDTTTMLKFSSVNNNIINCIGGGIGGEGISLVGSTAYAINNISINNNVINISSSGTRGILISGAATNNITINENHIVSDGATSGVHGIQLNSAYAIVVMGNQINGFNGSGIYSNTSNKVSIIGNYIDSTAGPAIRFAPNTSASYTGIISGNTITNYPAQTGIYIQGYGTITSMWISGNNYQSVATPITNSSPAYLGDGSKCGATLPTSGYILAGNIVYKGGTIAGGESPGWICTSSGYLLKAAWSTGLTVVPGEMVSNAGNIYQSTTSGTTASTAPTHTSGDASDGGVTWRFISAGSAATMKTLAVIGA